MEEQILTQPSTNQITSTPSPPEKQTNKVLIVVSTLLSLLVVGVLVYIGYQKYQSQFIEQQPTSTVNSLVPISEKPLIKMSLSDALSQFCMGSKIKLDKLPFTISESVKTAYKVRDFINCYVPTYDYANLSIGVETLDFRGDVRNIYFFHQNSKWMGMHDIFQPFSNYNTVNINGQNFSWDVVEPGPYGISTFGIWIYLIGEKKDTVTGTIVRVVNLEIIKDQQWLDLVKKYGSQTTDSEGNTIYVVGDQDKKTQFISEVLRLAPQNNALKTSAQNITTDLDGISF